MFEALFNGCFPILHNSAGPKDQVKNLSHARLFDNQKELVNAISATIKELDENTSETNEIFMDIKNYTYKLVEENKTEANDIIAESISNCENYRQG